MTLSGGTGAEALFEIISSLGTMSKFTAGKCDNNRKVWPTDKSAVELSSSGYQAGVRAAWSTGGASPQVYLTAECTIYATVLSQAATLPMKEVR